MNRNVFLGLVVLAAIFVVALLLAVRFFKWDSRTA